MKKLEKLFWAYIFLLLLNIACISCLQCGANEEDNNGICVCVENYELVGSSCEPVCGINEERNTAGTCVCVANYEQVGSSCEPVCGNNEERNTAGTCVCVANHERDGSICVPVCGTNEERDSGGSCVCIANFEQVGSVCLPLCQAGEERVGNVCLPECGSNEERNTAGTCVCVANHERDGSICVPVCGTNEERDSGGSCVCIANFEQVGSVCLPLCQAGEERVGNICTLTPTTVDPTATTTPTTVDPTATTTPTTVDPTATTTPTTVDPTATTTPTTVDPTATTTTPLSSTTVFTTVFIPPGTISIGSFVSIDDVNNPDLPPATSDCETPYTDLCRSTSGLVVSSYVGCVDPKKISFGSISSLTKRRRRRTVSLPFIGWPCTASQPIKKYALDVTKTTLASTLYIDCALEKLVQCDNNGIFDQPSQSCSTTSFTTTLSTQKTEYFNSGNYMALQSDYISSLHQCSNVTWPSTSSYKSSSLSREYQKCNKLFWFRIPDGTCNNLVFNWWGGANTPYKRLAKPSYEDHKEKPRMYSTLGGPLKNPRLIASTVHFSEDNQKQITHYLPIFGQYLMHDMVRTGHTYENYNSKDKDEQRVIKKCPCDSKSSSCVNIDIPKHDPIRSFGGDKKSEFGSCLVQIRERDSREDFKCNLGHREQTNEATAWLDMSNTYGNNAWQEKRLRSYKNGRLKASHTDEDQFKRYDFMPSKCDAKKDFKLLLKADVCFQSGDDRVNENPLLTGVHTIFLREHNRIAAGLSTINPKWDDERLYQEARRILNAVYQNVIYTEWLPSVLGEYFYKSFGLAPSQSYQTSGEYSIDGYFSRYDPYILPNVAIEFASAAGRFGHALVRSYLSKANLKFDQIGNMSISQSLFRPDLLTKNGDDSFNDIMRGGLRDLANNNQPHITKDLLDYLVVDHGNKNPTHFHSLPALNINRGREVGLQSYNKYRVLAGLNLARTFDELTWMKPKNIERLKKVYATVDDIDLFAGAMSEKKVPGGLVGPTFAYILARGFRDWKYADRFYYENSPSISPYAFTPAQLASIRRIRFSSILCKTLNLKTVSSNAFLTVDQTKNPLYDCSKMPQIDLYTFKDLTPTKYIKQLSASNESIEKLKETERASLKNTFVSSSS